MKKNSAISRKIFRERLENLGFSLSKFAEYVGYTEQAVRKWNDDTIPLWVEPVLRYLELGAILLHTSKKE